MLDVKGLMLFFFYEISELTIYFVVFQRKIFPKNS